jgi:hypothetical protein
MGCQLLLLVVLVLVLALVLVLHLRLRPGLVGSWTVLLLLT